jgi:hypothetical protein
MFCTLLRWWSEFVASEKRRQASLSAKKFLDGPINRPVVELISTFTLQERAAAGFGRKEGLQPGKMGGLVKVQ